MKGEANTIGRINPYRRLFAALSPKSGNGTHWIDYRSVSYLMRDAKRNAGQHWPGGWADLHARGWTIIRVDVVPSEPTP